MLSLPFSLCPLVHHLEWLNINVSLFDGRMTNVS
uniref:Uncharacterized protein n=1 Tax=Rhizophora mucronata TaxID=61149 RepID=A0A2P2IUQ8_RHIMU